MLCKCGCGEITKVAQRNEYCRGHVKGEHMPFLRGHQARKHLEPYTVDEDGCWVTTQQPDGYGYGRVSINGKRYRAHIFYYTQKYGPVPEGLILDHFYCDNRRCCNPDHVRPATHAENTQRGKPAKLDWYSVEAIRTTPDTVSNGKVGKVFGVSDETVRSVRLNKSWKKEARKNDVLGA